MANKKRQLYLGLNPSNYLTTDLLTHVPLIKIVPVPLSAVAESFKIFAHYTHILITSQSTIPLLLLYLKSLDLKIYEGQEKIFLAVGKTTAKALKEVGIFVDSIPPEETSEGLISLFQQLDLQNAHLFWPHSALSRPVIRTYLLEKNIKFTECFLYTTETNYPAQLPKLTEFDEIIFTSPSTVDAFLQIFGSLPISKILTPIGKITAHYLKFKLA